MAISFWRHSNKIRNQTGVRSQSTWALCFWLKQKVHEKWKLKVVAQAKSDLLIATSCCCPLCFFFVCVSYLLSGKQLTAQQPHIKGWLNCQRFVEICWSWILDSCIFQMVFVFFIWLIYFFFLASHLWSTNVVRHFSKIKEPERNSSGNYTNFIFSKHNLWRAFYFYFYFCVCIHKVYITTRLAYIYTFVCVNSSYVHGWKVLITIYI